MYWKLSIKVKILVCDIDIGDFFSAGILENKEVMSLLNDDPWGARKIGMRNAVYLMYTAFRVAFFLRSFYRNIDCLISE